MSGREQLRIVLACTAAFLLGVTGCELLGPIIAGSGVLIVESRDAEPFEAIRIGTALNAQITIADETTVSVEGDDNLVPLVISEVNDGVLRVRLETDGHVKPTDGLWVRVSVPHLSGVDVGGASDVMVSGLDQQKLEVDVSGASHLRVSGVCEKVRADVSGASRFDASELQAADVAIDVSGASHATVNASDDLRADVSGASTLRYSGAGNIDVDTSGVSSAKQI